MHTQMIDKRRGVSPQSTCRAEGNPGPEKTQNRNIQIRNLVVSGCFLSRFGPSGASSGSLRFQIAVAGLDLKSLAIPSSFGHLRIVGLLKGDGQKGMDKILSLTVVKVVMTFYTFL